jgi:hypothetical protein
LGFALSAGRNYPGSNIASALVTADSLYPALCAVPGCGKRRHDPIHWPSEPEADRNLGEFPADSEDDWHLGVGLVETEGDVTLEPIRSDGITVAPHRPSDKG